MNNILDDLKEKFKDNSITIIILITLICVFCALIVWYLANDMFLSDDKSSNNRRTELKDIDNTNNLELNNTEEDITDLALIEQLNLKTSYLINIDKGTLNDKTNFFYRNITNKEITSMSKLGSIILQDSITTNSITKEVIPYTVYQKYFPTLAASKNELDFQVFTEGNDYQIDGTSIDNKYFEIFGEKLNNHATNLTCPTTTYDEENKKYLISFNCEEPSNSTVITYNNRYSKDNQNAYVYVSVGVKGWAKDDKTIPVIYRDYEETAEYLRDDSVNTYQITESDYQEFSEYKITFKLTSNNYYFESVEKID